MIDTLVLDKRNVRLTATPVGAIETDIIADLFKNEQAFSLLEAIVKVGYLTHEVPIVVHRREGLVVAEGNRRVAVLKAIQNPYLAAGYETRILRLVRDLPNRDNLKKITVKVAPSRDDADQLIAALHTSNPRRAWNPDRQADFFQAQVDAGRTLAELKQRYPTVEVGKFVFRANFLNAFRSVEFADSSLTDYARDKSNRRITATLARLYESSPFQALLGLKLDEVSGRLQMTVDARTFAKIAEVIANGIREGDLTTRTLNKTTSPRYESLLEELEEIRNLGMVGNDDSEENIGDEGIGSSPTNSDSDTNPEPKKKRSGRRDAGTPNPKAGDEAESGSKVSPPESPKPNPRRPARSAVLETSQLVVPPTYPEAIKKILFELTKLQVEKFPNAIFDLMRTFLEKVIKAYADSLGEDIRQTHNQRGYVYLSHCLDWLDDHYEKNGPRQLIQVVRKVKGGKLNGYIASQDHLNAINHNHEIFATPSDVRECWDVISSILREILKP
ncbi:MULTISPECIES: hypothetical protein [Protofrankia]|uniref:hypothetical protein n=1 Tax=Protofrankia TaxID=2994361 RepID=UPI000ACB26AD|nr:MULTISPECIES: hypothetical protein [Protofrankia]